MRKKGSTSPCAANATLTAHGLEEPTYYLFVVQGSLVHMVFMHLWNGSTNTKVPFFSFYDSYVENAVGPLQMDRQTNQSELSWVTLSGSSRFK
jgi:hypothetical protein